MSQGMYKIIGADGKEYGPISTEQMRQWIAEGRVNAQTQILPEGATEWRPLADFPDLLGAIPSAPPSFPGPMAAAPMAAAAQDQVTAPAIALMVVAIVGFLLQVANLVWRLGFAAVMASQQEQALRQTPFGNMFSGPFVIVGAVIAILVSGLILFGAIKMKQLENYGLAMAASIIAMIPCISPCCIIGLPIGIWAVVILSKPEVKSAFH
jgi:hypothetical protein